MNLEETKEVLSLVKNLYRGQFSKLKKQDADVMVATWHEQFENVPKNIVLEALNCLVKQTKFVPTIAEVCEEILYEYNVNFPSVDEIIACIIDRLDAHKSISQGKYDIPYDDIYEEFPPLIQNIVVDKYTFQRISRTIESGNIQSVQGDIEKKYTQVIGREKSVIFSSKDFENILEEKKNELSMLVQSNYIENEKSDTSYDQINLDAVKEILLNNTVAEDRFKTQKEVKCKDIYAYLKAKPCDYDVFEDLIMFGCAEYICHSDKHFDDLTNGDLAELEALQKNASLMSKVAKWIQEE